MVVIEDTVEHPRARPEWYKRIAGFEKAHTGKALWQITNTLLPYFFLWYLMIRAVTDGYPYWIIVLLAVPAGLFMVRLFVLFHDCTHGSLFPSKKANRIFGYISGILTYTPYEKWRASHWRHHATVGDLDRRGQGDFWTMTKEEYLAGPRRKRLIYRLARNPFIAFGLGPIASFLLYQRLPFGARSRREKISVHLTNLAILGILVLAALTIGLKTYFLIQLPIFFFGGMLGFWLFYIQHNYDGVFWWRHGDWDRMVAAVEGCSFYKLPRVLQWFTGSIGFHFIHHLRPLIANYSLEKCFKSEFAMQKVEPLTIRKSLRSLVLHLWDEKNQKLIKFRSAGD